MAEGCTHDCSSCSQNCSSKKGGAPTFEKTNELSRIKKTIAVVSGKGGVGKTLVSSMLAVELHRRELKVAVMDADVTGPSIPKAFGLKGLCEAAPLGGIMPMKTTTGIEAVSVNLLLEDVTSPVLWRGPVIAGMVKQFWTDVIWGDVDVMVIDCPPGTGDVPLTIFQSIPVDGIVIVTSPQDLVSMIVGKAVKMAEMMNVPVLGLVENMSYVKCPDCGCEISVFGKSNIEKIADTFGIPVLARIPMEESTAAYVDSGDIESLDLPYLNTAAELVEGLL